MTVSEIHSKAVIVGGGFSGLATAITLRDHFKTEDFIIYDRRDDIGGTWHANTYPGCASDVPAAWYSLSTDLNPSWSAFTPPQTEMKQYLKGVVENHELIKNIRTSCTVNETTWDEERKLWVSTVTDKDGNIVTHSSNLIFMCVGGLVHLREYNVPGLKDKFKGDYFHTGAWRSDVSLKDKNVVVIGNGCSAAQVIPAILPEVKSVTQIVRSPHWLYPPINTFIHKLYRLIFNKTRLGMMIFRFICFCGAETKAPLFNSANFLSKIAERYYTWIAKRHMKKTAPKKYHDILIPEFRLGCKRMIYDATYLKSLHQDNIFLTKDTVTSVSEHAVHTQNGKTYQADVIIAATGYDTKKNAESMIVRGVNETIQSKWGREGVSAYNTVLVDGFPNMFYIAGPNHGTGHSSVVFTIECVQTYLKELLGPVLDGSKRTVEVRAHAYNKWHVDIQEALKKTVFSTPYGGCVSWYADSKGNATTYPWTQLNFWWRLGHPNFKELKIE